VGAGKVAKVTMDKYDLELRLTLFQKERSLQTWLESCILLSSADHDTLWHCVQLFPASQPYGNTYIFALEVECLSLVPSLHPTWICG
jgi:hypothetical protein